MMDNIDWRKSPEWAESVAAPSWTDRLVWLNSERYQYIDGCQAGIQFEVAKDHLFKIIKHRTGWQEGENRMEPIGQNGNDGEHYEEVDDLSKQPRYKGENGLDHIDEFARDNSIEDFRAAMRFTIGKYEKRLGKKDARSKELYKMGDYYIRWSQIEKKLEKEKGE